MLKANDILGEACSAMLELIVRTYSDEQMSAEVRDLSTELVDMMSEYLEKPVFLKLFNES